MRKGGGNGGLWKARKTIVPCFPTFPQTLEIARRMHRKMEIMQSDSHIPSAPAASITFISRKDKTRFAYPSPPSGSSLDWKRLSMLGGPARFLSADTRSNSDTPPCNGDS